MENGHSLKLLGIRVDSGLLFTYSGDIFNKACKWIAWFGKFFMMPLESINPGDAFKLGILGSVEKR